MVRARAPCTNDNLIARPQDDVRLRAVANPGEIEADDGFPILTNNSTKIYFVWLGQRAQSSC